MSCLVMSCLVLSCHVLSCLVLSCLVLSCLVLSCLVMYCLVLSCLVMSCDVLSCLVLYCLVLSCLVFSCRVLSCLAWQKGGNLGIAYQMPTAAEVPTALPHQHQHQHPHQRFGALVLVSLKKALGSVVHSGRAVEDALSSSILNLLVGVTASKAGSIPVSAHSILGCHLPVAVDGHRFFSERPRPARRIAGAGAGAGVAGPWVADFQLADFLSENVL